MQTHKIPPLKKGKTGAEIVLAPGAAQGRFRRLEGMVKEAVRDIQRTGY